MWPVARQTENRTKSSLKVDASESSLERSMKNILMENNTDSFRYNELT